MLTSDGYTEESIGSTDVDDHATVAVDIGEQLYQKIVAGCRKRMMYKQFVIDSNEGKYYYGVNVQQHTVLWIYSQLNYL